MGSQDHPSAPGGKIWRLSNGPMWLSGFVAALLGLTTLFIPMLGMVAGGLDWTTFLMTLGLTLVMALVTAYVLRDSLGKRPWRIEIEPQSVTLDLPAGRSLIHNPPACKATIPVADIAAIETRLEAYKGWIGSMMQRAYRLTRKDGSAIFLFEDRALLASAPLNVAAVDIANRTGVPLHDLGMAQGINGFLGVLFVRAPEWGAAALPPEERAKTWRRVRLTGALVSLAFLLFLISLAFR